jgi:hypothetical protein
MTEKSMMKSAHSSRLEVVRIVFLKRILLKRDVSLNIGLIILHSLDTYL